MDPILSLAVTVESNPGAYALLLGSGTSRSAQIPTGWDIITLSLVQRVAAAAGEDAGSDPEAWYVDRYAKAPRYSELLGEVTRSRAERARQPRSREWLERLLGLSHQRHEAVKGVGNEVVA